MGLWEQAAGCGFRLDFVSLTSLSFPSVFLSASFRFCNFVFVCGDFPALVFSLSVFLTHSLSVSISPSVFLCRCLSA